jgi:sugar phosphate isomerase/epimerase
MKISAGLFLTDILPQKRKLFNKIVKNRVFGNYSSSHVFSSLKKAGVDGVELFLPSYATYTDDDLEQIKMLLEKHNLELLSVHESLRFFTKTKIEEVVRLFHIAKLLSAKVIVLHIALAGKQIFDDDYIACIHELEKKYGIKVGFENREKVVGSFGHGYTWHEEAFANLLKKKNLHITLDTTHLAQAGGDIITFFKKNKESIVNIHLSDYKDHYLNSTLRPLRFKHLPIGKGELPMIEFIKTLYDEKYQGLVTMEMHTDLAGMCASASVIKELGKTSK